MSERSDISGTEMHELMARLYPICRSITGDGVRETLAILSEVIPLQVHEVVSGTDVFDWTVPDEWNIREAWIKDSAGNRIVDFANHNLHILNYSVPVHTTLSLAELKPHLHSLPDKPNLIPYRTSYYADDWGFCLPHSQLEALREDNYDVFIDASKEAGSLTYGELTIPGETDREILVYSHTCHPSLANDNLSGLVVNAHLAQWLSNRKNRYTYRFVFGPGTIGSITWLANNEQHLDKIHGGLVSVLLGGDNPFTYKVSRNGNSEIDVVAQFVLDELSLNWELLPFEPYGYDERQFGSPGIALNVGRLTRAPNNAFSEYHTSADNLEFVSPASLAESLGVLQRVIEVLDCNRVYQNLSPKCEPQLGKRGLYGTTGGKHIEEEQNAMLWLLNQSDGKTSLLDIAQRSGLTPDLLADAADRLINAALIATVD